MVPPTADRLVSNSSTDESNPTGVSPSIKQASELLKIVSNPDRLGILLMLEHADRTVSDLLAEFPGSTDQFVSRHLGILRRRRLVEDRVVGAFRVSPLTGDGRRLVQAVGGLDPT